MGFQISKANLSWVDFFQIFYLLWNISVLGEYCRRSSMFGFQAPSLEMVDLKEIDIFTAPLCGSAWVQIWIWKEEMKRWKSPSSVSSSAPPPGYEWMGNWSRSRSIGWGGLLADMARGGRGSRNIEEIPNVWSNKYWEKMEEIQHNVWNKYWRNKEEIQHYQGLIADIARGGRGSRNMEEIQNVWSNKYWKKHEEIQHYWGSGSGIKKYGNTKCWIKQMLRFESTIGNYKDRY